MGKKKVSIVTVTQWKRRECLRILADMICEQTYKIFEWVIVEGSQLEEDGQKNATFIEQSIQPAVPFVVRYVPYQGNPKIGYLRNQGNRVCRGDIIVCMDDDDYYFPTRVQHAVEELSMSRHKLAGCSALILYDWNLDRLYKFKGFGPNHSTNACMAWKQQYKKTHDDTKENAEEASFTDNFRTPMIQLDAYQVMVVNSHSHNTFNKRELLVGATLGLNYTCEELTHHTVRELMGTYYDRYKALFWQEEEYSSFDVVFYMGGFGKELDNLLGTVQAVIQLSQHWAAMGKKVAVYGQIKTPHKDRGVQYFDWKEFDFRKRYRTVILWRIYGFMCGAPFHILADNLLADLQDAFIPPTFEGNIIRDHEMKVTRYIFKTNFHAGFFQHQTNIELSTRQYSIIPNGVDSSLITAHRDAVRREPYRFCYTTCYTKGLEKILKHMWPLIHEALPSSEFHVYYGMEHLNNDKFCTQMSPLLSQSGVVDHGRQPMDAVIKEKMTSTFYLFTTDFPNDADSINIKECCALGCIPILSDYLLYKDLDGVHYNLGLAQEADYISIAKDIVVLTQQETAIVEMRRQLMNKAQPDWADVAKEWWAHI